MVRIALNSRIASQYDWGQKRLRREKIVVMAAKSSQGETAWPVSKADACARSFDTGSMPNRSPHLCDCNHSATCREKSPGDRLRKTANPRIGHKIAPIMLDTFDGHGCHREEEAGVPPKLQSVGEFLLQIRCRCS
jgi:hypothetical protein